MACFNFIRPSIRSKFWVRYVFWILCIVAVDFRLKLIQIHLVDSVVANMLEKTSSNSVFLLFIVLLNIKKQLRTFVVVKLWLFFCCVESYNLSKLRFFPHLWSKIVCRRSICQFAWSLHKIQIFLLIWLKTKRLIYFS